MSAEPEPLKPLRTWSHLAGRRRRPSEYEIVSTNLMYDAKNAESPFELGPNIPLSKWFKKYRHGSPLTGRDWEEFRDPDELTYRAHVWQFDVTTGQGINPQDCELARYPVKIEHDEIYVDVVGIAPKRVGV